MFGFALSIGSISLLSSENNLKRGTLWIIYLCFLNYNKNEHSKAILISCYIIVKKVSSSFRKTWLHQKIYYNIALTLVHYDFLLCVHPDFL